MSTTVEKPESEAPRTKPKLGERGAMPPPDPKAAEAATSTKVKARATPPPPAREATPKKDSKVGLRRAAPPPAAASEPASAAQAESQADQEKHFCVFRAPET